MRTQILNFEPIHKMTFIPISLRCYLMSVGLLFGIHLVNFTLESKVVVYSLTDHILNIHVNRCTCIIHILNTNEYSHNIRMTFPKI